jgi:hypothetical protein
MVRNGLPGGKHNILSKLIGSMRQEFVCEEHRSGRWCMSVSAL